MRIETILGVFLVVLIGCSQYGTDDVRSELDCQTKWTDDTGRSHCDHLKSHRYTQERWNEDSTAADTLATWYYCADSTCVTTDTLGIARALTFKITQRKWTTAR